MSTQQTIPFDVCANRHGGNPESVAANLKAEASKLTHRSLIYEMARHPEGVTCREAAAAFSRAEARLVGMNAISGRFTELAALGKLQRNGERRDGCAVWVVSQ